MKKTREGPAKNALKQKALRVLQRKKAYVTYNSSPILHLLTFTFLGHSYDQQADGMRQQSFNMEQATMALQTAKDTQVVMTAMKAGVSQMKKEYKKVNIDNIEVSPIKLFTNHNILNKLLVLNSFIYLQQDLQDEMADILELSEEVQGALGRSYNMPDVDEDELEAELDALGDEIALDDDSSYLDDAVRAPNAPDKEPARPDSIRNTVTLKYFLTSVGL